MSETQPLRLLIVEDQPELRQLCARLATRLGLEFVEAGTAEEALAIAERRTSSWLTWCWGICLDWNCWPRSSSAGRK